MSRTPGTNEIAPRAKQAVACRYGTLTHSQTRKMQIMKRKVSESLKCLDDMGGGAWRVPGAGDLSSWGRFLARGGE